MPFKKIMAFNLIWIASMANASQNIHDFINKGKWTSAARAVYEKSWERRQTFQLIKSLSKSGFIDIALNHETDLVEFGTVPELTAFIGSQSGISKDKERNFLKAALDRSNRPDQIASVASGYAEIGDLSQAYEISKLAIARAENKAEDLAYILSILNETENPEFISKISSEFYRLLHQKQINDSRAYIEIANFFERSGDIDEKLIALRAANKSIAYLPKKEKEHVTKKIVDLALGSDFIVFSKEIGSPNEYPEAWSRYYSRHGYYKQATDIAKTLPDGMYVSRQQDLIRYSIQQAIKNNNLTEAWNMLEQAISPSSIYTRIATQIGNKLISNYDPKGAMEAYSVGLRKYTSLAESNYNEDDSLCLLELAQAASKSGDQSIVASVVNLIPRIIEKHYPLNLDSQILSRIYFSKLLQEAGEKQKSELVMKDAFSIFEKIPMSQLGYSDVELKLAEEFSEMGRNSGNK